MAQINYPVIECDFVSEDIKTYKGVFATLNGKEICRVYTNEDSYFPDTDLIEVKLETEFKTKYRYGDSHWDYFFLLREYCYIGMPEN